MSTDAALAAVHQYIDAFNNGDATGMAAVFAGPGSILDGMAPHVWQGPTAAQDWYRDVLIEGEQHGASGYTVTLGEPLHNNVTGDSAYMVVPATMTFAIDGRQVTQTGAFFTVALRKVPEGWRIAAWAWSKGRQWRRWLKCSLASRYHHLLKTFWTGTGGWADKQLPDGTVIWRSPSGRTYTTQPGSRLLFPTWHTAHHRGAMMPTRRRTRAADRAHRINAERALNNDYVAQRNMAPPVLIRT